MPSPTLARLVVAIFGLDCFPLAVAMDFKVIPFLGLTEEVNIGKEETKKMSK